MTSTLQELTQLADKTPVASFQGTIGYVNDPQERNGKTSQRVTINDANGEGVSTTLYNVNRVLSVSDKGKTITLKSNSTKDGLGGVSVSKNGQYTNLFVNSIATVECPITEGGHTPAASHAPPPAQHHAVTPEEFAANHRRCYDLVRAHYEGELTPGEMKDISTSMMIQFRGAPAFADGPTV